ncbi:MAG: 2-hydroxychromene-2-carboxylate isomerase [Minwuia sp.]|nr:2-hydroxychromene-2-carboxylate isomerase [Minwuia sp.]
MAKIEFYYDCSSPWTYLAISRIGDLARRNDAELYWRPVLVGGIFNQVNEQVYQNRANPDHPKYRYMRKDLMDWAAMQGLEINWPSIFPVNSVKGMRAAVHALDNGKAEEFAMRLCHAYWGEDRDISQDEVVASVADDVGLDGAATLAATADQAIKDRLKDYTQQVVDRGGFGSPTIFINDMKMFFGNDRMDLIEWTVQGRPTGGPRR